MCAGQGLISIYSDLGLDYAELGLQSSHHDVRLSALSALQVSSTPSGRFEGDAQAQRLYEVLLATLLCRQDDLILAQEARKVFLKDLIEEVDLLL